MKRFICFLALAASLNLIGVLDILPAYAAPPTAPSNLTAASISSTQIDLSWKDNASTEAGFKVQRSTSSSGTYSIIATVGSSTGTGRTVAYSDTSLPDTPPSIEGRTYYYKVYAYLGSENSTAAGPANAVTKLRTPTGLTAIAAPAQVSLSWADNSGAETAYYVQRMISSVNGCGTDSNQKTDDNSN